MTIRALALLSVSIAASVVAGCGSSSSSGAATTTATRTTTAHASAAPNVVRSLPGTTRGSKPKLSDLKRLAAVRRSRIGAHLTGLAISSPTQKLITLAESAAGYWTPIFQSSNIQLPPVTVNIVDQVPVPCGATQITTNDAPVYCGSNGSIDLPLAYMESKVQPIGDAALALVISDLYGYHVENVLHISSPGSGFAPAALEEIDSCFSGTYFGRSLAPSPRNSIQVSVGDQRVVDEQLAAQAIAPGTPAGPGVVTAAELIAAFNQGAISPLHPGDCVPKQR